MRVSINYLILSLYFFVYVTPAYINGIFLAYDKVFPQMLIISLLNIFSFTYIYLIFNLKDYILSFEYKNHYVLNYLLKAYTPKFKIGASKKDITIFD